LTAASVRSVAITGVIVYLMLRSSYPTS